jgi:hypothetical protein
MQHLKHESWIVHGITKAEHALPISAHIPHELIIVDCELPVIDGKDFVRLLHNAREWRAIYLVALTNCIKCAFGYRTRSLGSIPGQKRGLVGGSFAFLGHLALKNGSSDHTITVTCRKTV